MSTVPEHKGYKIPLVHPGDIISSSKYLIPVANAINESPYLARPSLAYPFTWSVKNSSATAIDIPTFSIFTSDTAPFFSDTVEHRDLVYRIVPWSDTYIHTEILLTNRNDEIKIGSGGSAEIIDYYRPFIFRYDSDDSVPFSSGRLGPKKDSFKMSTEGCGFVGVSQPDQDKELIWAMRVPYKPLLGRTKASVADAATVTVDEYDDTLTDTHRDIANVTNNTGVTIAINTYVIVYDLFGHFNKQMIPSQLDDCP